MSLKYRVEFSSNSKKQLKKYDKNAIKHIISSIEFLTDSPYNHPHSKRMKGYEGNIYRLRVGGYSGSRQNPMTQYHRIGFSRSRIIESLPWSQEERIQRSNT